MSRPAESFDAVAHIDEVTAMVQAASALSLDWFRQPMEVVNKGSGAESDRQVARFDPVTEADRAVEDHLRGALTRAFPGHTVMGEEGGTTNSQTDSAPSDQIVSGQNSYRWVIDPIDGTRAFIAGQPLWGTILGLQQGEEVIAGWLHQPTLGHTYVASPAGAYLHESNPVGGQAGSTVRPLATSSVTNLTDAVLVCTHPDMFETEAEVAAFSAVSSEAKLTRFGGDCVNYGYVASGYADLVIENQLQPYDIIPLIPIIKEAGGVITDLDGKPPVHGGWAIGAATPELHANALDVLRGHLAS